MKCKPGRFVMGEAVPFGQSFTYYSTDPMEEMLKPEYYSNVVGNIRMGDTIKIFNIDGQEVIEVAEVLVTSVVKQEIKLHVTRKPEKTNPDRRKPGPKPKVRELKLKEDKGCVYLVDEKEQIVGEFANAEEARKAKPELERAA